jgi:purine-binding chemotaxis protein CheW
MIVLTNQYVTFKLDDEIYALDVAHAREIVGVPRLTRMPKAPAWIRGVINLRGSVVPVIDLKHKFEMGATEIGPDSCVLIVEFMFEDAIFVIGVLVDAVLAVFELAPSEVEAPPKFGARYSRKYLKGVGRLDGRVFMILEADEVFSDVDAELAGPESGQDELPSAAGEDAPSQIADVG